MLVFFNYSHSSTFLEVDIFFPSALLVDISVLFMSSYNTSVIIPACTETVDDHGPANSTHADCLF